MSEQTKKVGERIKLIRLGKNVPQAMAAEAIGVSQSLLSNIESGRCNITLDNLIKLHEALDCPMRDFFVDIDGPAQREGDYFSLEELARALASLRSK